MLDVLDVLEAVANIKLVRAAVELHFKKTVQREEGLPRLHFIFTLGFPKDFFQNFISRQEIVFVLALQILPGPGRISFFAYLLFVERADLELERIGARVQCRLRRHRVVVGAEPGALPRDRWIHGRAVVVTVMPSKNRLELAAPYE